MLKHCWQRSKYIKQYTPPKLTGTCDIWVCNNTNWTGSENSTAIGCNNTITVSGEFDNVSVMASSNLGKYNMVLDCDRNGIYDNATDALDDADIVDTAGFYICPEAETLILLTLGLFVLFECLRIKRRT